MHDDRQFMLVVDRLEFVDALVFAEQVGEEIRVHDLAGGAGQVSQSSTS